MSKKHPKRPRDANKLAFQIVQESVGEDEPTPKDNDVKDPAAVALGRKGGLKGGKARAMVLSAQQRSDIARKAAQTRWNKENDDEKS